MEITKKIVKLEEHVINRIAAGEVIQRPANAVKELVENCLDAGAKSIQVSLNAGGLKRMIIVDSGCGIQRDDMEIVCERFTTSKLTSFDDLSSISTYGFRGEALASISHVAHLTITTKTKDSVCAYRASYQDGKLKGNVTPCAGNQGTQINVEDLFYNVPVRRKAIQNGSQEHAKVADMLGKYAIHNSRVSFQLQKVGTSTIDLKTFPDASIEENIRTIYGNPLARELVQVGVEDDVLKFKASGRVTNANFSLKKMIFLLFINHRLVDSSAMRKAIDAVYENYLPKKGFPFIYLNLEISPENVDVNVHPTKHEVNFLHEEKILKRITETIEKVLLGSNVSRTFYVQALLPSSSSSNAIKEVSSSPSSNKVYDHQLVRTDSKEQKLDAFVSFNKLDVSIESNLSLNHDATEEAFNTEQMEEEDIISTPGLNLPTRREVKLSSISNMKKGIASVSHSGLRQMFRFHKFGSCINKEYSLVQYKTGLYLINVPAISYELFYQILVIDFANFGVIKLEDPISIYSLATLALDCKESGWSPEHGKKEDLAQYVVKLLTSKADMLSDYYSVNINQEGKIKSLPLLLDNYIPDMSGLPMYILRLATEVDWDDERNCFETLGCETAKFYQFNEHFITTGVSKPGINDDDSEDEEDQWKWIVEHVIFPACKSMLQPPRQFVDDGSILEIAELSRLYKVFERC